MSRKVWACIVVASFVQGCAFRGSLVRGAVEFNEAAAQASEQILLTNVLRAMDRRALVYTEFTKITGSISGTIESGGIFPFGGDAGSVFLASPLGRITSGPTFDVRVLNTKDFVQGIRHPVPIALFEYYWRQGFNQRLLLHLLVREIRVKDQHYVNYPPEPEGFRSFVTHVESLGDCRLESAKAAEPQERRVPSELDPVEVVDALSKGIEIREAIGPSYTLVPPTPMAPGLVCDRKGTRPKSYRFVSDEDAQGDDQKSTIHLRSPEAVIYYLGELTREMGEPSFAEPRIQRGTEEIPLFQVERYSWWQSLWGRLSPRQPEVVVRYRGSSFAIPWSDRGRRNGSLSALAIASQLLALQSARAEPPATQSETITILPLPR